MLYLGINAAFGNSDCARLPLAALDLKGGRMRFPRPKTGVDRRCSLWPETVAALQATIEARPTPADPRNTGLVFITKYGKPWESANGSDAVTLEFGKLLRTVGLGEKKSLGFYALRHTFRTVADATRDIPAVRLVMGHVDDSMDAVYRERIDDDRLEAVTQHVREWLFGGVK
jgi:integrase